MKKTQAESHFTLHLHLIQYTCHQTVLVILMTSPRPFRTYYYGPRSLQHNLIFLTNINK